MNRFHYAILIILVSVLGGAWTILSQETVFRDSTAQGLTAGPQAGYLAPDFALESIQNQQIVLGDLRGQPLVINFWATWCPPCRAEMPHLDEASSKYEGQVRIIAIDQGESREQVEAFASEIGITFPLLVDEPSDVSRVYGVRALPTTFFVDKNGIIVEVFTGTLNRAILEDRIGKMLREG
jgi:thiol-disulfide isomerase/thioredoxin